MPEFISTFIGPSSNGASDRAATNRANALAHSGSVVRDQVKPSTGPKTDAGKQRSAMNAFRHGFTGQIRFMCEEDRKAYLDFQQSFLDAYTPKGPVETQCVQSMVDAAWQLNRTTAWRTLRKINSLQTFSRFCGQYRAIDLDSAMKSSYH